MIETLLITIGFFAFVLVAGYVLFANEAWGLALALYLAATAVLVVVALLFALFGSSINRHQWVIQSIVVAPLVILVAYQIFHLWIWVKNGLFGDREPPV